MARCTPKDGPTPSMTRLSGEASEAEPRAAEGSSAPEGVTLISPDGGDSPPCGR